MVPTSPAKNHHSQCSNTFYDSTLLSSIRRRRVLRTPSARRFSRVSFLVLVLVTVMLTTIMMAMLMIVSAITVIMSTVSVVMSAVVVVPVITLSFFLLPPMRIAVIVRIV